MKFFSILFLLIFLVCDVSSQTKTQSWVTSTYRATRWNYTGADGRNNVYNMAMPYKDSALYPSKLRPVFIVFPGLGEMGSGNQTEAKTRVYGPFRDIYNGWNGGIVLAPGDTIWPIYIFFQPSVQTNNPLVFNNMITYQGHQWNSWVDPNRRYLLSISAGGKAAFRWIQEGYTNGVPDYTYFKAMIVGSARPVGSDITNVTNAQYYAAQGGHIYMAVGVGDTDPMAFFPPNVLPYANAGSPGAAVGLVWQVGDGNGFTGNGHCCWNHMLAPTTRLAVTGSKNVYEWAYQFGGGPTPPPSGGPYRVRYRIIPN